MASLHELPCKFVFVTGGVVSSLGKGLVSASIGTLLECRGFKVSISKADPYINIDPGTMSPVQHGEVFVTEDGAETDLDIGHYERFTNAHLTRKNSFSSGQIYDTVLSRERRGDYLGGTVQVVPHITNCIKEKIYEASIGVDFSIIEIGGTVGDIEGLPYFETIRQIRYELGSRRVVCIHLTLVPYIAAARELKTKPTQHSVKELRSIGIQPDVLICRTDRSIPEELKSKIALFCNVPKKQVIEAQDMDSIYKLPLLLHSQGLDDTLTELLAVTSPKRPDLSSWIEIEKILASPIEEVHVAIVGKYTQVVDSYKSLMESLVHGALANGLKLQLHYLESQDFTSSTLSEELKKIDAVVIPGGFGERGIEEKIQAITLVREKKIPFLGICLGMQLSVVEYARNVLGLKDAHSKEFAPTTSNPVVALLEDQEVDGYKGATMRLGSMPLRLVKGSEAWKIYGESEIITERHRHRYEVNNAYVEALSKAGMKISGLSDDKNNCVEIIELEGPQWFLACQFHPELKSKPTLPHPLFVSFISAARKYHQSKK